MTQDSWQKHLYNFLVAVGAVMLTAALQAAIGYIQGLHPDLFAGASQLGAAAVAVKFLGQ
jgi:N-formylglutamate amidohydrolase